MVVRKLTITDVEFAAKFENGGPSKIADEYNTDIRIVYQRRRKVEQALGRELVAPRFSVVRAQYPGEIHFEVRNGTVIAASDFHYWPGDPCVMHRALIYFCRQLKPKAFIANGDVMDGATISRHPPLGWESRPTFKQELETAQDRMHDIVSALPRGCRKTWPIGNHDFRFEMRVAAEIPEIAGVQGVHLKDHFPLWEPCWSTWINDELVIKHRFKGGIHAAHNNTLWAGKSTVTGHLHSAKVTPFTDFNGTRYGVDLGCIADKEGRQFSYSESNPRNWREAFGVFTFCDGYMLQPELCFKVDDKHVQFRGDIISV